MGWHKARSEMAHLRKRGSTTDRAIVQDKFDWMVPSEFLRCGQLEKKLMDSRGVSWTGEILTLTDERVLLSKTDDREKVFDLINLEEIVECELKECDDEQPEEQLDEKGNLEVIIRTTEEGYNGGRRYDDRE